MPASVSIGQRFTQLIQHLGLSKNAFAQSLDKTATVIQHLVDERNEPGYKLLCKVFAVYPNVSKDWLMEGAGPMLKTDALHGAISASPPPTPTVALDKAELFAAPMPLVAEPAPPAPAPVEATTMLPPVVAAPVPVTPAVAALPSLVLPVATASPAPPDPAYLTAALQTQYLQHQLALAEQRNQHLLEQQALMQQMVAVLQRSA